jgi:hypothetical protein
MEFGKPVDFICNGIRVRSRIPLRFPQAVGDGHPAEVTVERGAVAAPPLPADRDVDIFVEEDRLAMTVRGVARYLAAGGTRIVVDPEPGAEERDVLLYLSGSMMGAIWLQRELLPLHASAVELPGGGCVAFTGPSGAGKSSLAAHFARAGHGLVADDVCVLAEREGGYAVWPGPARVKLAPDALDALNEPKSGLSHAGGTREKYHLDLVPARESGGSPVPLRCVFLLSYGDDSPRVLRLQGLDAIDAIGGHTYRLEFVRPLGLESGWLRRVASVARIVPVYRLIRPSGHDRADAVIETLLAVAERSMKPEVQS